MHEIEEERERWRVERDVWERTAEALLSQRAKPQKSEVRFLRYTCEIMIDRATGRTLVAQRDIYETDLRVIRLKVGAEIFVRGIGLILSSYTRRNEDSLNMSLSSRG